MENTIFFPYAMSCENLKKENNKNFNEKRLLSGQV